MLLALYLCSSKQDLTAVVWFAAAAVGFGILQKKYQDKYATELVAMRIKQAKESQLKWLAMVEKEMGEKVCITKSASSS